LPFGGWEVHQARSAIAEVYPTIWRRYPQENRTVDQQDAYAITRWLREMAWGTTIEEVYFNRPMTGKEKETADLEDWTLVVM
jgi:hypothetical protein